jgi:hypothetical protein
LRFVLQVFNKDKSLLRVKPSLRVGSMIKAFSEKSLPPEREAKVLLQSRRRLPSELEVKSLPPEREAKSPPSE